MTEEGKVPEVTRRHNLLDRHDDDLLPLGQGKNFLSIEEDGPSRLDGQHGGAGLGHGFERRKRDIYDY
jgi:hypothetical protein